MNNSQFRKLLSDTPARPEDDGSPGRQPLTAAPKRSFMPMTPRNVKGGMDVDFARQVRERNAALQPSKKFKSHAPKGVKFAAGYIDRAKAREEVDEHEEGSKAARIKALEEQMKLGQISQEMFEQLRDQITGGDITSTHLVKGLDRKLLERVRRGEDVLGSSSGDGAEKREPEPDVDDELDKLNEQEVQAVKREEKEKKGTMAPPSLAGKKRSRDEIMAELKAQRQAAMQSKAKPVLSDKWRKVGEKEESRIEIDAKGREVLITVDEDGTVKKKVRKLPAKVGIEQPAKTIVHMPDASKLVLGADAAIATEIPQPAPEVDDEDDDIFERVGTEYNPLGDDVSDEDDEDSNDEAEIPAPQVASKSLAEREEESPTPSEEGEMSPEGEMPPDVDEDGAKDSGEPAPKRARRNYFKDSARAEAEPDGDRFAGIEHVLKKAAQMDPSKHATADNDDPPDDEDEEARQARLVRRAQMLAAQDRDLDDIDMGFGSSRFEDEADIEGEGQKIRLSEWKGGDGEGWEEDGKSGKGDKKKRKPKKRKGDGNNMADVMRVIEGRKNK